MNNRIRRCLPLCLLVLLGTAPAAIAQTVDFSGYSWQVRDDTGGPGPNTFLPRNVSVDSAGALHLHIAKVEKHWTCAEINTVEKLGYGTYEFVVDSRVDRLDRNVVLGLFNYPDDAVDGTNEMDIEYARWGNADAPNLGFTVYPAEKHHEQVTHAFTVHLNHAATTNRFIWSPGSVAFMSRAGTGSAVKDVFAEWKTPESFSKMVSHRAMPVHLNLWLFQSTSPSDEQPVEIVIKRFTFTPAS